MNDAKIRAIRFKQKDLTFYSFVMNSNLLRKIAYALPKSRDDPEQLKEHLA